MKCRLNTHLTFLKAQEEFEKDDLKIEVMNREQFEQMKEALPHKKTLLHQLERIHYCKAEMFGNCVLGAFAVPNVKNLPAKKVEFGFYMAKDRLIFIEDTGTYVESVLNRLKEIEYGGEVSIAEFFTGFLDYLIEGDSVFLQEYEEKLIQLEDSMMKKLQKNSYEKIIRYRKDMMRLHAYFTQLENMGDIFRSNTNHLFKEEERDSFAVFSHRAGRLHDHTEMLQDYIVQIRELYQSQIDLEQNHTMNLLTVVTTIFLPLSLIVGWYGMNFTHMPELSWTYGYVSIFILSIVIVLIEIYIFKKKHLL